MMNKSVALVLLDFIQSAAYTLEVDDENHVIRFRRKSDGVLYPVDFQIKGSITHFQPHEVSFMADGSVEHE